MHSSSKAAKGYWLRHRTMDCSFWLLILMVASVELRQIRKKRQVMQTNHLVPMAQLMPTSQKYSPCGESLLRQTPGSNAQLQVVAERAVQRAMVQSTIRAHQQAQQQALLQAQNAALAQAQAQLHAQTMGHNVAPFQAQAQFRTQSMGSFGSYPPRRIKRQSPPQPNSNQIPGGYQPLISYGTPNGHPPPPMQPRHSQPPAQGQPIPAQHISQGMPQPPFQGLPQQNQFLPQQNQFLPQQNQFPMQQQAFPGQMFPNGPMFSNNLGLAGLLSFESVDSPDPIELVLPRTNPQHLLPAFPRRPQPAASNTPRRMQSAPPALPRRPQPAASNQPRRMQPAPPTAPRRVQSASPTVPRRVQSALQPLSPTIGQVVLEPPDTSCFCTSATLCQQMEGNMHYEFSNHCPNNPGQRHLHHLAFNSPPICCCIG